MTARKYRVEMMERETGEQFSFCVSIYKWNGPDTIENAAREKMNNMGYDGGNWVYFSGEKVR